MLFLFSQVLLALGLAVSSLHGRCLSALPAWGRLAYGLSATPFVTASLTLTLTVLWPHHPLGMLAAAPGLVGLVLIAIYARSTKEISKIKVSLSVRDKNHWITGAGLLILFGIVMSRVLYYVPQPTGNSDTLQYLAQARHLLLTRDLWTYPGLAGLPDGTLRGDVHGPLWIAYLASALVWAPQMDVAALDAAARLAFPLTLLSYMAAGVACTSLFRKQGAVLLTLALLLAVPHLSGTIIGGDRDAFRLAALLLLMTFLLAETTPPSAGPQAWSAYVIAAALGFWATQGHGLGVVLTPLLTMAWFACTLVLRAPAVRALALSCAVALGFAIAVIPLASSSLRTGTAIGDNVTASHVLEGTVYAEGTVKRDAARVGAGDELGARLWITVKRDYGWPSGAALLTLIVLGIVSAAKLSKREEAWDPVPLILAGWFIANSVILLDILPTGSFTLGAWTVLNPRYAMQWYVSAALLGAWGLAALIATVQQWTSTKPLISTAATAGIVILATGLTIASVERGWAYYKTDVYRIFAGRLNDATATLSPECRVLSEDTGVTFLANRPVVQLYSKPMRPLLQASDPASVLKHLDDQNLCAVVLYTGLYIDVAGPQTPLAQALASKEFQLRDASPWRIYVRAAGNP